LSLDLCKNDFLCLARQSSVVQQKTIHTRKQSIITTSWKTEFPWLESSTMTSTPASLSSLRRFLSSSRVEIAAPTYSWTTIGNGLQFKMLRRERETEGERERETEGEREWETEGGRERKRNKGRERQKEGE
jgi:hypothetical protein